MLTDFKFPTDNFGEAEQHEDEVVQEGGVKTKLRLERRLASYIKFFKIFAVMMVMWLVACYSLGLLFTSIAELSPMATPREVHLADTIFAVSCMFLLLIGLKFVEIIYTAKEPTAQGALRQRSTIEIEFKILEKHIELTGEQRTHIIKTDNLQVGYITVSREQYEGLKADGKTKYVAGVQVQADAGEIYELV